ncbi:type III-B CRISPR module RAMP protein Cmr6 [bacterium]|nr:type III-B CRISPR module RAMP protein Cmr6 [bacterium]
MVSIRIPENNKYFPYDTFKILQDIKNFSEENNFYYLLNIPKIDSRGGKLDIKINEDIQDFKWKKELLESIVKRQNYVITQIKREGYLLETFTANLLWRLVIGLGTSHPQEVSMTLHHIYGIPYIPGSAIKGVTRYWTVLIFAEKLREANICLEDAIRKVSKALEDGNELDIEVNNTRFKDLITIFGTQKQEGKVIFIDAYPVNDINLKIDIINPHYPKYYSRNEPPADWQLPTPIKFLTVERTSFKFYLLSKNPQLLSLANTWLKDALSNVGIGSKTSLGYGIFSVT